MGCSSGGVRALRTLLAGLSPNIGVPLIVTCHLGDEDPDLLSGVLDSTSALPVREALERQRPVAGMVHLAPSGYHLLVEPDGRFALSADARVRYSRPSIDVLFDSAARCYGRALVGVLMTGANDDGADGLKTLRERGGVAIVQSPDDAETPFMPAAGIERAGADHVVPLADIAPLLNRLCLS